eukprot:509413_1
MIFHHMQSNTNNYKYVHRTKRSGRTDRGFICTNCEIAMNLITVLNNIIVGLDQDQKIANIKIFYQHLKNQQHLFGIVSFKSIDIHTEKNDIPSHAIKYKQ